MLHKVVFWPLHACIHICTCTPHIGTPIHRHTHAQRNKKYKVKKNIKYLKFHGTKCGGGRAQERARFGGPRGRGRWICVSFRLAWSTELQFKFQDKQCCYTEKACFRKQTKPSHRQGLCSKADCEGVEFLHC